MTYIKELDIIRFFAFLLVFTSHYFYFFRPKDELTYFFTQGDIGVQIFFILSGFLITTILMKEQDTNGVIDFKRFYVRRVLRIWPLYFFVVTSGALLALYMGLFQHVHLLSLLTFTSNFTLIHDDKFFLPLIILWSLAVEEQFYVIWPAMVYFIKRKYLQIFLLIAFGASLIFKYFILDTWQIAAYHSFSNVAYLALGCLIAFNIKNVFVKNLFSAGGQLIEFSRIAKNKFMLHLGKISYGLYMYHIFALMFMKNYFLALALTVIIAHLSYKYFEQPIIRYYKAKYPSSVSNRA